MKQEEITELSREVAKSLMALYLEVPEQVAEDVNNKVSKYIAILENKLASLDQTGIDLREVEKLVQEFIRTENSLRELRWVTTLGVETTAEAYRKAIGYTLNDLEQFKNDEG